MRRRPAPPGQHGRRRTRRESDYLQQLREKQKLQWFYGVPAGQLRRTFAASSRGREATGGELLRQLEERLDNTVYRLGFAGTRAQARQFVTHGHVQVNGARVNRPSYQVKPGDTVSLDPDGSIAPLVRDAIALGFTVPGWLHVEADTLSGKVTHRPARAEIDGPVDENRVVDFFSKY